MNKSLITYAQNREDLLLYTLLYMIHKGFYVDVGANHPHNDSVTKFFYLRGWKGINIEPITSLHKQLAKARPRDINLNVGVAQKRGTLELREYGDEKHGLSTFSKEIKEARPKGERFKDYFVEVTTLKHIFDEHEVSDIDFLKVDVEGLEYEVLAGNDWKRYRPKIILVENTPGKWTKLLREKGYVEVFFDGLNRYFVRKDLTDLHTMNYGLILAEMPITPGELKVQKELKAVNKRLLKVSNQYAALWQDWTAIHKRPQDFLGIKSLTSALLKRLFIRLRRGKRSE